MSVLQPDLPPPVYCETCGDQVHRVEITTAVWEQFETGAIGPTGEGPPKQPARVSVPGPTTTTYLPCRHPVSRLA